jgi:hypothetical protein
MPQHPRPPRHPRGTLLPELLVALVVVSAAGALATHLADQHLHLLDRTRLLNAATLTLDATIEGWRTHPCLGTLPPQPPHAPGIQLELPPAAAPARHATVRWTPRRNRAATRTLHADEYTACP